MKELFILVPIICVIDQIGSFAVIERSSEVHPNHSTSPTESITQNITHRFYENQNGIYSGNELDRVKNAEEETENFNGKTNQTFIDYGNVTSGLLMAQYERCLHSKGFLDCLKFKTLKFVKDLFEPITSDNVSDVVRSRALSSINEPILIRLPPTNGTERQLLLMKTMQRAFGSSGSMEILKFVVQQLDDFMSQHGVLITVKNVQGDEPVQLDAPWLIDSEHVRERRSNRKVKKKEFAIIFPMLVLFKFLKIKMLLVPILLGVIFLKKLLILTLTLLPYLIGLFGCCRRIPFFGQLQSAGILQEVDTRGEFSQNLGYSFPYRDFAYRQKDRNRPSDAYSDY